MQDGCGKVAWLESNNFVGSSHTGGDFIFLKPDLNWPYFTISNTLESHIINLKPQNSKICTRNEVNRDRDLFMYTHIYMYYKNSKFALFLCLASVV